MSENIYSFMQDLEKREKKNKGRKDRKSTFCEKLHI